MDLLTMTVEYVLPRVSSDSARVVRALIATRGIVGRADDFASAMGLRNRHQLHRILAADGLPCLEDLAGWIRLLGWTSEAERLNLTLERIAHEAAKSPRTYYRTVQRLTGKGWREVLVLGSDWVLLQFIAGVRAARETSDEVVR